MRELMIEAEYAPFAPDWLLEAASRWFTVQKTPCLQTAEAVIGEPALEALQNAPRLRWLQMTWAGADRYLHGGFPRSVLLTTASGAFGETIAEHAIGMLLSLCRRLPSYARQKSWNDLGSERCVAGGTALIFGAGDLGGCIAHRLQAFGVKTFGVCRRTSPDRPGFDRLVRLDEAETLLPAADFVLGAMPQSPETAGWLSAERLALLPQDAVVVNVGRGSFLDADALARELQSGHLFGAGLDVTNPEPLPAAHPLWSLPNCILTPHVAGVSFGHLPQTEERIWRICAENLERYATGEPLRNLVREIPL